MRGGHKSEGREQEIDLQSELKIFIQSEETFVFLFG
jgi:hypothetical protein